MNRAMLPWLFTALAVASPPLLWAIFWFPYGGSLSAAGGFFWFFFSLILVAVFLTLATLMWTTDAAAAIVFKYVVLIPCGWLSILISIAALLGVLAESAPRDVAAWMLVLVAGVAFLTNGIVALRKAYPG